MSVNPQYAGKPGYDENGFPEVSAHLKSLSSAILENIFSGAAADNRITEGGVEDKSFFTFQVVGADATNTCTFEFSLNGLNFNNIPLINIETGAAVVYPITADGAFRVGTVADQDPIPFKTKSIRTTKGGAGATQMDAYMEAS